MIEQAKPGNTIVITKDNEFLGMEFLVVECPAKQTNSALADKTWVEYQGQIVAIKNPAHYKIVRPTMNNESDVDIKLKNQRDANLRGVFG